MGWLQSVQLRRLSASLCLSASEELISVVCAREAGAEAGRYLLALVNQETRQPVWKTLLEEPFFLELVTVSPFLPLWAPPPKSHPTVNPCEWRKVVRLPA